MDDNKIDRNMKARGPFERGASGKIPEFSTPDLALTDIQARTHRGPGPTKITVKPFSVYILLSLLVYPTWLGGLST